MQRPFAPRSFPLIIAALGRLAGNIERCPDVLRPPSIKTIATSLQAEGDAADARREVATLERDNVELAATNRELVQRVEELECQQSGAAAAAQS